MLFLDYLKLFSIKFKYLLLKWEHVKHYQTIFFKIPCTAIFKKKSVHQAHHMTSVNSVCVTSQSHATQPGGKRGAAKPSKIETFREYASSNALLLKKITNAFFPRTLYRWASAWPDFLMKSHPKFSQNGPKKHQIGGFIKLML